MGKRGRPKREQPLTEEQISQRRARYNASRRVARRAATARLKREQKEWEEVGWIVRKMNREGGLSQEKIRELLGGLVIQKKIQKWCSEGFKPC